MPILLSAHPFWSKMYRTSKSCKLLFLFNLRFSPHGCDYLTVKHCHIYHQNVPIEFHKDNHCYTIVECVESCHKLKNVKHIKQRDGYFFSSFSLDESENVIQIFHNAETAVQLIIGGSCMKLNEFIQRGHEFIKKILKAPFL